MSKHIAIDYDQTLVNSVEILNQYVNNELGITSECDAIEEYYAWKTRVFFGPQEDKFLPFFSDERYASQIVPLPGVIEKLQGRKEAGYTLSIITARDSNKIGDITRDQVRKLFGDIFTGIYFTDNFAFEYRKKSEIIKEINAMYMIEDNYKDAVEIARNNGIPSYLLGSAPWNKHLVPTSNNNFHIVRGREDINI